MEKFMPKYNKLYKELNSLQPGEYLDKKSFMAEHWPDPNYFVSRSLDVHFHKVKKMLPEKVFKCIKGNITRIS